MSFIHVFLYFLLVSCCVFCQLTADQKQVLTLKHAYTRQLAGYGLTDDPWRWDDQVAASAEAWSKHLGSSKCSLTHSGPGENLAKSPVGWDVGTLFDLWTSYVSPKTKKSECSAYVEKKCPKIRTLAQAKTFGHFTQVIWNTTAVKGQTGLWSPSFSFGCGLHICKDGASQILTCQYRPAGNVIGYKALSTGYCSMAMCAHVDIAGPAAINHQAINDVDFQVSSVPLISSALLAGKEYNDDQDPDDLAREEADGSSSDRKKVSVAVLVVLVVLGVCIAVALIALVSFIVVKRRNQEANQAQQQQLSYSAVADN